MNQDAGLAQRENEAALAIEFDKLALKPGETLVIRPSVAITRQEADSLLETTRRALPDGVGVLLVASDTGLGVFDAATTAKIIARATPPTSH